MKQHVGCFDVNVCMTISTEKYWNILNPHSITIMVGFLRFCCLNSILIQFLGPPPLGFCKIWISKIHSGLYNWNIMSTHICMITINVTNVLLISYHTHIYIYHTWNSNLILRIHELLSSIFPKHHSHILILEFHGTIYKYWNTHNTILRGFPKIGVPTNHPCYQDFPW